MTYLVEGPGPLAANGFRTELPPAESIWSAVRDVERRLDDRGVPHSLAVGPGGVSIEAGALVVQDRSGAARIRIGALADGVYGIEVFDPATGQWRRID